MKIIIAGAGAIGTHLATMLAKERQDIILIDEDEEKLSLISSNHDLMTVVGKPISIATLKEVGAGQSDLFIAVTTDESRNLTACIIAHSLGAKKTVARVDDFEYVKPKNREFWKELGIDSLIYPEMLAAEEIVLSIRMSWVKQWTEFYNGALIMIGVKMLKESEILNKTLAELGSKDIPFHVVAISRDNKTIIPHGDHSIIVGDIVYFITTKQYIPYIRKISGQEDEEDIRNVLIMGGSRIASRTTMQAPDYMNIKIIEQDKRRCERLVEIVKDTVMVINGDGRDLELLKEEGLEHMDAFVALTGNSETNILACLSAQRMGISKSVAEVENLDYINMAENLNIGSVINKKLIAASHIYQMMLDADVTNVKCLTFANADVAEFQVKEGTKITKRPVKDLDLPKGVTIGGLIRKGQGLLVTGDTMILPDDHVMVFCLNMMIKKIEKYFK
ncbi:MAG: Trk system potassium transporter TrkA [Bacteroidaceae bacterium]